MEGKYQETDWAVATAGGEEGQTQKGPHNVVNQGPFGNSGSNRTRTTGDRHFTLNADGERLSKAHSCLPTTERYME